MSQIGNGCALARVSRRTNFARLIDGDTAMLRIEFIMPRASSCSFSNRCARAFNLGSYAAALLTMVATMACGRQPGATPQRQAPPAMPVQVAHWDPGKQRFVNEPVASGPPPPAPLPEADAGAIVLQRLPSGKGTFIDLHGRFRNYMMLHAKEDGSVSGECRSSEAGHP